MTNLEIFTLQEAAAYLKISERTVYDWAQKGKIPGGKIGTSWRFIRHELEAWVEKSLNRPKPNYSVDSIEKILSTENIIFFDSADKSTVLTTLIDRLSTTKCVTSSKKLTKAIYDREDLMSTGIGLGVGVPHVRIDSIKSMAMAIAICKNGIADYDSLDSEPVKLVFMIIANTHQHPQYLKILSQLSKHVKNDVVKDQLLTTLDAECFYNVITGAE